MFNPNATKSPSYSFPTHKVEVDALYFIPERDFDHTSPPQYTDKTRVLQRQTGLLVLEHGIGVNGEWAKIELSDGTRGFVLYDGTIIAAEKTANFYPLNKETQNQPNPVSADIDWKEQPINVPYEDEKNGSFVVHCELQEVTDFSDKNLLALLEEARVRYTRLILDHVGYSYDEATYSNLLRNYYLFSRSEDWFVDPRPCSTMRVAVAIPKRYLFANNPALQTTEEQTEAEEINTPTPPVDEEKYFVRSFGSREEYRKFFDNIANKLNSLDEEYRKTQWIVAPQDVKIDFSIERANLLKFVDSTDKLLDKTQQQEKNWTGNFEFIIDKNTNEIKEVNYTVLGKKKIFNYGYVAYLRAPEITNRTTISYIVSFNSELGLEPFITTLHYPTVTHLTKQELDLVNCAIDTATRIKDLASIRLPSERAKWKLINEHYERNLVQNEGDLFKRSLINLNFISDRNIRILMGADSMSGMTEKQKLDMYVAVAASVDWAKFLGIAAQCLSAPVPADVLLELMETYKDARKFIEQILATTACNPYLRNGLKIINGFQLPVIAPYNPNEILARELESVFIKIINDLVTLGIKASLLAAAKACASGPYSNLAPQPPPPLLDDVANSAEPALNGLVDTAVLGTTTPISDAERDAAKEQIKGILEDVSSCLTPKELCALFKGNTVNDEIYQLIFSLVNRKYGQVYASAFTTKEQISSFFAKLGANLDLSLCDDLADAETPSLDSGRNIFCDDGSLQNAREKILADRGLTPEMIDEVLQSLRDKEKKALEDVLKLLDSDNPFDFSKVPDLGCKVFPSGETLGPSMQSFTNLLNSFIRSVYDTFDKEAQDWYKTTYSSKSQGTPSVLQVDPATGAMTVASDTASKIPEEQTRAIQANSGKLPPEEQESNSSSISNSEEIKYPSFMFKQAIKTPSISSLERQDVNGVSSMVYTSALDGDIQQRMDLPVFEAQTQANLKKQIELGEKLLGDFAQQMWLLLSNRFANELVRAGTILASNPSQDTKKLLIYQELRSLLPLLISLDVFLKGSVENSRLLKNDLATFYKVLGISDEQESNGIFAAENGAAVYIIICEQLQANRSQILSEISRLQIENIAISSPLLPNMSTGAYPNIGVLLAATLQQYEIVKDYYRSLVRAKVNYPDFDITYESGLNKLLLPNNITRDLFQDNQLYDLQRIEILRNKKNFIKVTEISKVDEGITNYVLQNYPLTGNESYDKELIFQKFIESKVEQYGVFYNQKETMQVGRLNYIATYQDFAKQIDKDIKTHIQNKTNKFLFLKDTKSPFFSSLAEEGAGQPFTQYLKLVVPQTPQQQICGIRPHYLDIDSIKQQILDDKSACIEKPADTKTTGNRPISTSDIGSIETSSTQDSMLSGMYRLAVRVFLHDILLRGIPVFGYYDPQSLRKEPAFISFMSKMAETEMRGLDNGFFVMLENSLLKKYKQVNKETTVSENILKNILFRDFVADELKNYVLPKLAKRINADTNQQLVNNVPKDNPIVLNNIYDDLANQASVLHIEGNSVFLRLLVQTPTRIQPATPQTTVPTGGSYRLQKIFEATGPNVFEEFRGSIEFRLLFEFLFPLTQTLNNLFILSCLSTSTRRQVVNAFKGTKKDIITTSKVIQTGGQEITRSPTDAQSASDDPMQLIIGFIAQAIIKTPIGILKGIAEITEPNIAISSAALKAGRMFDPRLSSFIIPAVSIPLGTLPTPITCPLPFVNPILAMTYFGTLAWYDDNQSGEMVNDAAAGLENNMSKQGVKCGSDTINQDNYYLDKKTSIEGLYDITKDRFVGSAEEISAAEAQERLLDIDVRNTINDIFNKVKTTPYVNINNLNNPDLNGPVNKFLNDNQIRTIISSVVLAVEKEKQKQNVGFRLTYQSILNSSNPLYKQAYEIALANSRTALLEAVEEIIGTRSTITNTTDEIERGGAGSKNKPPASDL